VGRRTPVRDRATSFGGELTTTERRARWGDAVPDGFIRLSVDCEDGDDILDDLAQALDRSQDFLTG
jgi:cystathionine gamma-lyase